MREKLTIRQLKTIKFIGRWADGHCTNSKAIKTHSQLEDLGLLRFRGDCVILTKEGREIYKDAEQLLKRARGE